jgi:hypothetical protein
MIPPRWPAAIACAVLLTLPSGVLAARWVPLAPGPDVKPVTVRVNGHPRGYYRLTQSEFLILTVDGPGRLRLLTRAEIERGKPTKAGYRLRVTEGAKTLKDQSVETAAAEHAALDGSDAVICKSRNLFVAIPQGTHRVKIAQHELPSVLVRPFFSAKALETVPAAAMISITPIDAARSVTLSEGERLIPYFSALPRRPVHFRIIGPTTLELTTRLDFDDTMRGTQVYRIGVSSGRHRIREVTFRTTKATTATYTDLKDRVPSKLGRIVVPVAEGTNDILVELLGPKKGSAEINARIPQPSTGNEQ